jgi:hypothetical protein
VIDENSLRETFDMDVSGEPEEEQDTFSVSSEELVPTGDVSFSVQKEENEFSGELSELKESNVLSNLENIKVTQKEILEKSRPLLDAAIEIAMMSQHPQSISAAASLITSINNASELIAKIDLNLLKIKASTKNTSNNNNKINIDKAVFVGSTAELQKILKEQKNEQG